MIKILSIDYREKKKGNIMSFTILLQKLTINNYHNE